MEIIQYSDNFENQWDDFIENRSVNGSFLQTRRFLNYHPKDRFKDYSLLFKENGKILAVCPACVIEGDGKKIFFSHKGSTYGGIIASERCLAAEKLFALVGGLEEYLKEQGFNEILLKNMPAILCRRSTACLEYVLWRKRYIEFKELNLFVDLQKYASPIVSNFSQGKRTNINNCKREQLFINMLTDKNSINEFYDLLCITLKKYNKNPVHTLEELMDLKLRFPEHIIFLGAYKGEKMLAGGMLFLMRGRDGGCVHTQYLAADPSFGRLSPMTFMYYSVLEYAQTNHVRYVSWGISTENLGMYLNHGLAKAKEAYGSEHSLNRTYIKQLK